MAALIWSLCLILALGWSLTLWALHALAQWSLAKVATLGAGAAIPAFKLPDWLAAWLPPGGAELLASVLQSAKPALDAVLAFAPGIAGWVTPLAWLTWAAGLVVLAVGTFALNLLVRQFAGAKQTMAPAASHAT